MARGKSKRVEQLTKRRSERVEQLKGEILTVKDIAQMFGIHPSVVHSWFRRGLKRALIGKKSIIKREWLDEFIHKEDERARLYIKEVKSKRRFRPKKGLTNA